jgi:hypothetical protein
MAGISLWPDLIRLAVDEHAKEPTHGMLGGATRGTIALVLTIYIIFCMITKQALITG